MKRIIILLLALALACCGAGALAEWQDLEANGVLLDELAPTSVDLDGDGTIESVAIRYEPEDGDDGHLQLVVTSADGVPAVYDTEIAYGRSAWACDLNRDGLMEIFLWGDVMSDDYCTWCLHYDGDHLAPVLFPDARRGENSDGYFKVGYGMLVDFNLDENMITLSGSQDVLGTYSMSRTLSLSEDGLFEFADDGIWVNDFEPDGDEFWDGYGVLTLKASVACVVDGESAVLSPGDRIRITATDKREFAAFITEDGRAGTLSLSEDYERGWGMLVDGIPEDDAFEFIPYAD